MVTLEQLIKIKSFENDKQKAVVGLLYVAGQLKRHQENILSRQNLTYQQFNVLRILRGQQANPVSINLIKERLIEQTSDVSRIIERMNKAELISIKANKADKRVRDVMITQKGLDALAGVDKFAEEMTSTPVPLTTKELDDLNLYIAKILNKVIE